MLCSPFTLPYFHHLIFVVTVKGRCPHYYSDPWYLLFMQFLLLFIVCFLSSLAGLAFSRRLDVPGLGDPRKIIRSLPLLLFTGVVMIVISIKYGNYIRLFRL